MNPCKEELLAAYKKIDQLERRRVRTLEYLNTIKGNGTDSDLVRVPIKFINIMIDEMQLSSDDPA